jgi:hypothetical protein
MFTAEIAGRVLQIPFNRLGGEDFVSWPHTRSSTFSVRLANLACADTAFLDHSRKGRGMVSDFQGESKAWKKLWVIKAPGKMQITLWRFAHNYFASGMQLHRRHIPASPA